MKRTSVRQSEWGFGLFMEESVRVDELIDGKTRDISQTES